MVLDIISYLGTTLSEVHFNTPDTGVVVASLLAIFLLFVSGFASGSEIAFSVWHLPI